MTNPQDNAGTHPPPTPSNTSTPPPPSTSPKPRLQRVKMLARKTVACGALRKKLNEKLKASHAQNSDSNFDSKSYQSAIEGEEPESSDSEKTQESPSKVISSVPENLETRFVLVGYVKDVKLPRSRRSGGKKNSKKEKEREGACGEERGNGKGVVPAICGVAQERVEESGMKSGGSGSRKAVEGLVHLSTQRDEPISSTEETITDLLKKVGASYDPKKCRTPTTKALNVPKPSKKRKASSPTPTASSFPKGRATRSRVKQSEADLQRALDEMEVPTLKPQKPKTSSKKSSSVSEAVEPTLAKRTRSVVKNKQSKISEDDDWSGEEEENDSEKEHDKLSMFGKRKILKGRLLKDLVEQGMMRLEDALVA
ncbi:uncharacterized protein [Nicotiana sylvestris]|uniref:uncharacterized protein n=1 Tax=Nicotiana sylvestris TaxID=4096 RepID=UPI00388C79E7